MFYLATCSLCCRFTGTEKLALPLEIHSYTSQCEISLGNWCPRLSGIINIINMVSRKVSLARAALSGKVLQPILLFKYVLLNMPSKHSDTAWAAKKRRQSLAGQHLAPARAEGKPWPMEGRLETY